MKLRQSNTAMLQNLFYNNSKKFLFQTIIISFELYWWLKGEVLTGQVGTPSMARNALSKLVYWSCCHWFAYKNDLKNTISSENGRSAERKRRIYTCKTRSRIQTLSNLQCIWRIQKCFDQQKRRKIVG